VEVDLLLLVVGLGALFVGLLTVALTVVFGSTNRSGVARALADIDQVYATAGPARPESLTERALRPVAGVLTEVARALTPSRAAARLHRWLDYAGNPPAWPPVRIVEAQGVGLVVLGAAGALTGLGLSFARGYPLVAAVVLGLLAGGSLGLWLPFGVVFDLGQRRQQKIRDTLPDALDMLTLCVEAGLGFDAALVQVAGAVPGPLGREIARALHEMQMGKRRADAMRALADRTTVPELRTVAVAVVQATELGIPIATVLREQATTMRARRRQRAEEKARKVPVKVLFPLVFCLFPALFIIVLGPGVLRILDTVL
jgi:tight adherence protein C